MPRNINTSVRFDPKAKNMLNEITRIDRRSQTQEIFWLIEKRYDEITKSINIKCTPDELLKGLELLKTDLID